MTEPNLQKLVEVLRGGRRLHIFLHDNPDPDAIAGGLILSRIAVHAGLKPLIFYGGKLGRAENRAMVKLLKIPLKAVETSRTRILRRDRTALVDTQPGAGNNSFPRGARCHVVIDHHPLLKGLAVPYADVRPDEGSCVTILIGYLEALGLEIDSTLATAAAYAILSETQDLEREATPADRAAYLKVIPKIRLPVLGKIRHPLRHREYYKTVARAMKRVVVGKNTCICHIGPVHSAEIVAEIADFLAPMEMVTWCMVTGYVEGRVVVSIRTTHTKAHADRVMKSVLGKEGRGGGHHMMAGGSAECRGLEQYESFTEVMAERFLKRLRRKVPETLRPLLFEEPPKDPASPSSETSPPE
jgi:nanoRNase/pAp phosphatase (c-di-AMP/oligoRNAs hydrolase)